MARKNTVVVYRRKREGKTNYKKRLALLKSMEKRLVIRKSVDNISAQIIEYYEEGDKVLMSAHSKELLGLGWKFGRSSVPAAYLTGLLIGKKAMDAKLTRVVPDFGFQRSTKGSKIYAVLKGVKDAGIDVPVSEDMLPADDRVDGSHISSYAGKLKDESKELFKKQFGRYEKEGMDPAAMKKTFEDIKKKIIG